MGDLLEEDYSLVEKNALYRCLDKVLAIGSNLNVQYFYCVSSPLTTKTRDRSNIEWKALREENRQQVSNKGHERQQKKPT